MQFLKQLTDPALKRLYKFVLKRMIGRFLAADELDLDQLNVHLRSGRLELCDLLLNAEVLNAELCEAQRLPFKVKKGYLGSVRVAISYADIMSESCLIEIDDIEIILVPLEKHETFSRFNKATDEKNKKTQPLNHPHENERYESREPIDKISEESLDFVASWIEQVTSKIKVTVSNICVRLETGEQHKGREVALLCQLEWMQFTDESASEFQSVYGRSSLNEASGVDVSFTNNGQSESMVASRLFGISQKGIKFRGFRMDLHLSSEEQSHEARGKERRRLSYSDMVLHSFLESSSSKQHYIQVKLSHYEALDAPTIDASVFFHSIRIVLQPQYLPELGKIVDAFSADCQKSATNQLKERFSSSTLLQSVCDDKPAWLTARDEDDNDRDTGALNLSLREFQRIEQLLHQYRQTQDELKRKKRHDGNEEVLTEKLEAFLTRKLSAVESIESVGLSDLDIEEDAFFECETGLASSMMPSASLESFSQLNQSMYSSAQFDLDGAEKENKQAGRNQMASSTTAAQNRGARRVQSRLKVHLLQCECIILYDDLPDNDEGDGVDEKTDNEISLSGSRVFRAAHHLRKDLPSVDGLERLVLSLKDVIYSSLVYSQYTSLSATIGKVILMEKTLPRMSLDATEEESAMLSTSVLSFAAASPFSGQKINLSANVSAQVRIDYKPEVEDKAIPKIASLGVRVQLQSVFIEWDMYLLDRAHRLFGIYEEESTDLKRPSALKNESLEFAKTLDVTTECVQVTLRFPMITSDLIRFGVSSKRGLCEDRLVVMLGSLKMASLSPLAVGDDDEIRTPMLPRYRKATLLPWLDEYAASFDKMQVSLLTPEDSNQRSENLEKVVLFTSYSDERLGDGCTIRLRLQNPSREEMKEAIRSKQLLSQDGSENPDVSSMNCSMDEVSGDDNDGGRVGLNGWDLEALGRTEAYEKAAAAASLYSVEINLHRATAVLLKSSLDRLMVLCDALLMINPIDVDSYNQMFAAAVLRNRLMPSYMSLNLTVDEGTVQLCDYLVLPPAQALQRTNSNSSHVTQSNSSSEPEKVLFKYHFVFETLKVFQVSQWMGQLVSRVHVVAQNATFLEECDFLDSVAPILYRTPFGASKAPIVFMGVDIADQTNVMRDMKVDFHLSHVSLRYDVRSKWLFHLLEMVLMDYPVPIIPLDSATMSDDESRELLETMKRDSEYEAVLLAIAPKTVFTKLFVNCYDVLVDYAPVSLTSRTILVFGKINMSSNVVTGAVLQGYKVSVGDLEMFLAPSHAGYGEIDQVLLGNELLPRPNNNFKKKALKFAATYAGSRATLDAEYPSLLIFLETFGFLQLVTMDFVDVFLRVLIPPTALEVAQKNRDKKTSAASAAPELSVELNLGTANIYACYDSFNTLLELLSVWTDQLASKQDLRDSTAYVGLDGKSDSVSVVTNLSPVPASGMRSLGTTASEPSVSSLHSCRSPRLVSEAPSNDNQQSVNVMEQVDKDAFGSGKKIFPGKTVATDTEARLLRTRLDSIQKERKRMVEGLGDQLLVLNENSQSQQMSGSKPVRINELLIENYYAKNGIIDSLGDASAGAFLKEPEPNHNDEQQTADRDNPWFSTDASCSPGVREETTKKPFKEEAVRWLARGGSRTDGGNNETPKSKVPGHDYSLFEPVEDKMPMVEGGTSATPSSGRGSGHCSNNAYEGEEKNETDHFDANHLPMGAFPAASKNWWGMHTRPFEVELSDIQTEETTSSFSHGMDSMDERSGRDVGSDNGVDVNDAKENGVYPSTMSMSICDVGEDEGKEVKLEFDLDSDLQSRLNQMLDFGSNDGHDGDEDRHEFLPDHKQGAISSPRAIPTRQTSFCSTRSQSGAPSSLHATTTMSPPDQPTARWFYDGISLNDGSTPMTGLPSRIYPHHVEIPVGGSATSLSFGKSECEDAIRSIARESAVRKVEATSPVVVQHVLLRNFNICMRFFGGCDWTRDGSEEVRQITLKASNRIVKTSVQELKRAIGTKEKILDALLDNYVPSNGSDLFGDDSNSTLFRASKSAPSRSFLKHDPTSWTRAASGDKTRSRKRTLKKSGRKTEEMLELVVTRIQMRLDLFDDAETQPLASHTVLALGDLELLDYISTSQIRKIICYWKSAATHPRESGSSMVRLQLITVRPGPKLCEEHRLKARMLPLRINLDQEVVKFLRQFVPTEDPHRQSNALLDETDEDVTMQEDGSEMTQWIQGRAIASTRKSVGAWFFQSIDIKPCKIKIDYRPNHVNYAALRAGDYIEVINLFVLEGMELVLRRVQMSGIDGWAALGEAALVSWVQDISRRQIHKCVASVSMPPLRPFVNIGAGAADLILLPMEHYGRDRRFVRGLKRGASSFLKSVTIETLTTASKVAQGTQALLEHADDVVSSSSALRRKQLKYRQAGSRIARNSRRMGGGGIRNAQDSGGGIGGRQYLTQQPASASEGFGQAYDSLARELHVAAKTIVAVPLVEYKKTGSQGYVRSVIRAVPVAVLRPMIGASEAVAKALIGVRNAVDPELKEDIENKFKDFRAN
ncbi:hypothetical protein CCR75_007779 [Bremia lactucae]|uniref:Autophagy-related protein 2 n=1 Tax=Bremia lactucae TaxID=4779 RepID=A0A976NYM1_BRELC|nr:hypothetical protein CCR75_007779 [Bremia lactucae]